VVGVGCPAPPLPQNSTSPPFKFVSLLRAKATSKFSPRFARKQNQNFLRASRESNIKNVSALRAKEYQNFLRASRESNIKNVSALRAKAISNLSPRFARN
jgi:hypothetical protein